MFAQDPRPDSSHTLSRRHFLRYAGAGLISAVIAALDPQRARAMGSAALPTMATWKPSTFTSRIGQAFTVNGGPARNVTFKLVQVQDGIAKIYRGPKKIVNAPAADCFVLVFRGPRDPALAQGTYAFAHPQLKFSLFITPGKISPQGQNYEAVVNHVHA